MEYIAPTYENPFPEIDIKWTFERLQRLKELVELYRQTADDPDEMLLEDDIYIWPITAKLMLEEEEQTMWITKQCADRAGYKWNEMLVVCDDRAEVEQYLPKNYRVIQVSPAGSVRPCSMIVAGYDNAGWTATEYVIPRLSSGLIPAALRGTNSEKSLLWYLESFSDIEVRTGEQL